MSDENEEIVRGVYEAWNRGDLEATLAVMHPAIKIDYAAGVFPGLDETYEGHTGARKYWRDLRSPWTSLKVHVETLHGAGDRVATVFTFEGEGRDGIVVRRRLGNVLTLTDGLVSRLDAHGDPSAALEAVGLRE
jgi:ketosteroid isomerase-like protein